MPIVRLQVEPVGPVLEIGIRAPLSETGAHQAGEITWVRALVDTGCSHTSIHRSVSDLCALELAGTATVLSGTGRSEVDVFAGDLFLRSDDIPAREYPFHDRRFSELVQDNAEFDAILGMDMLQRGLLLVHMSERYATYSW